MNATNNAPLFKTVFATIAMAAVAVFGIICTGTVNETLLDTIQAW